MRERRNLIANCKQSKIKVKTFTSRVHLVERKKIAQFRPTFSAPLNGSLGAASRFSHNRTSCRIVYLNSY